jgi:dipeptidyl aminopeptidase/acylaminoacyl peptidase
MSGFVRPSLDYALKVLTALVLCAVAASQWARANDIIPRKLIFGNPERSAPYISPDGKSIAYTAAVDEVMNVWVAPIDDLSSARPITHEKTRPITKFQWALNGTQILYFQDHDGDENFHLFSVDLQSKTTKDLTPYKTVRAEIISESYARPDEVLVGLNNRDQRWHDAWMINTITRSAEMVQRNDAFANFIADNNLSVRLAAKPLADGGLDYFSREKSTWKRFARVSGDDAFNTEPLYFTADNKSLYWIDSRGRDKSALSLTNAHSKRTKIVAESNKSDIAYVLKDPISQRAVAAAFEYDRMEWRALDTSLKPDIEALRKFIPGNWFPLSQSKDNALWTVWIDNPGKPIKFALYNRADRTLKNLFTARPNLEGTPLPMTSPHIIRARDGLNLVSYLTIPKSTATKAGGKPANPLPMVLMVHGGPWSRDSLSYNPYSTWLANRGYAVLTVNFRGSTGFGKAFVNAGDKEWGGKMHNDLIDAVDWAINQGIAQPNKVAIYGTSYGGYAALVGLTATPKKFACAVDIVGPSNLATMLSNMPAYWQSYVETFKRRLADPSTAEGRNILKERSPLFRAENILRPLLIGQGANDPRVTQKEADQIVTAMRRKNLPVTYVLYADEGHGFARAQNRLSFNAITESFLAQCLGGRLEPIGSDFEGSSVAVPVGKEHIKDLSQALAQP